MENSGWRTEGFGPRVRRSHSEGIGKLSQMLLSRDCFPAHRDAQSHAPRNFGGQRYLIVPVSLAEGDSIIDKVARREIGVRELMAFS
jgi:hypothetical protein